MSEEQYEGVAIIGMSGRFPGAESVEEFWSNLVNGKDTVSFFTDAELTQSGLNPATLRQRGKYVPARGILQDAECFDASFFGVHPKEAEVMDPQHRVFLEACWAALERSGYPPSQIHETVGLFAGTTFNTYYSHVLRPRPDLIELVGSDLVMYGNEKDYLTTRVAYKLGLKGPAVNVSTACSTSLVAVCQACQSLLIHQCDVALAGGASVRVPQKSGYYYDEGNIGSPDGHTRTFDERAAGTVFSNGVAVVVLKRLEDAMRDGDQVYAVIKGTGLNNDGSQRVSFGAPGVEGQSEAIAMAHAMAGFDPETITYVEAHGTATPLGDPIEVAALTKAFRLGTDAKNYCALGSVKSNVGHLDAAAGVTGLIKTALALHNKVIPASLHFTKPNPKLELESSPFYVNDALQEWQAGPDTPRRAGVSSFGTGGTNAHVVLEEAPEMPPSSPSRPWQLLVLSAKTREALDRATVTFSEHLNQMTDADQALRKLADTAFTLQTGRNEFSHRRIVVCRNPSDGMVALKDCDPKRVFTNHQELREPPVVFMFPGQGAQYAGMGSELYRTEPVFQAEIDRCAELLLPILQADLRTVMFPAPGLAKESEQLLVQTRFTQPALFVIEYALAKLWMSWGVKPAAMIGHSVGEYAAGCLAGVFTLEEALVLVAKRAALVQAQPGGAMLAIRLPEKEVLPLLNSHLEIAAINSPNLCVASGPHDGIAALEKQLESQGITVRHLHTSHAFHSSMMDPVLEPFTEVLRHAKLDEPQIPFVSNVTGNWITPLEAKSPEYWAGHVRQAVRFADGIAQLIKDTRYVLLEVGPGQTLSTLARQHPGKSAEQVVLASLPFPAGDQEPRGILETLGRLWMNGVAVNWQSFYTNEQRRRVVLPTYPFERKRYWPESVPITDYPSAVETVASDAQPNIVTPLVAATNQPVVEPAVPRKERLLGAVRSLLQELSGYDLSTVDTSANLLELGLDSLLLTQASQLFQRKFGVSITFRQLMEELGSLADIASYLNETVPPEAFAPPPPAPSSVATMAPGNGGVPASALEQLLQQQQQLTNQLLQLMGRQSAHSPTFSPVPAAALTPTEPAVKAHGPFKPIDRNADKTLSPDQSKALDALIARYTRRTAGSKALAKQNRPILADPRSVSGFKQLWKEMVYPISTTRSDGSKVWDVDGNEYVDFVMGFGASMFGHRPPFVIQALQEQLSLGFEIGPIQPLAGEVASLMKDFTGMERVGFTNTGSEAVLAATRVARTVTGRDKIAVFAGSYHGIFDEVLFRPVTINGETRTAPIAPGIPESSLSQVIVLDYGNPQSLELLRDRGSEIAAVLVEPVQSRRLDLQPREFMHELRRITKETGSALIFDEVVTGFRVHPGGAQAYFGVRADLATYGKVIGGGLPIGVVAGDSRFMDALDGGQWEYGDTSFPEVGVTFFAGTFVRHPLALAAVKAVLTHLKQQGPELQRRLAERTAQIADQLRSVIDAFQAPYRLTQFSSMMQLTFPPEQKYAGLLFYLLRGRGIHIYENRAFVLTTAHTDEDLAYLVRAFRDSLSEMQTGRFLLPGPGVTVRTTVSPASVLPEVPMHTGGRADHTGTFPLTEAQKEIWMAIQMEGDASVAYNESLNLQFRGSFDVELFRTAARQVAERHPILLASISADGQSQQVRSDTKLDVPLVDLSTLNEPERKHRLDAIIEHEVSEPFGLTAGPLLRVRMLRLSNDHHLVIWTAHHIVCDGWSGGLLISELATIYSALKQGTSPILEVPVPFREYALAAQAETPQVRDAEAYWTQQFLDVPAPLDLPTDRARPLVRSTGADTLRRTLDSSLHHSLKRVAGQHRTTLVVLLLTGLKTLLYRLTGQTDIVVGLGVAGQAVTGNNCLVGHCLNTLPIRTQLVANAAFQDNLAAVKKSVLDGYDHHQCTIGGILQHIAVPRSLSRPPLVEVLFNVDRDPGAAKFQDAEFTCSRNSKQALHFDLFLNLVDRPHGLCVECDYNTDLFDSSTIDRWLGNYETLLESLAANPAETVANLPILTKAEHDELIAKCNETTVEVPMGRIHEWFELQAVKTPEARAVTFEGKYLTYSELNRRANQLAQHLTLRGVGPDVLVGLCVERSLDMVIALFGILKAGGAYVPLDPSFPQERLAYMVEDSGMHILVTHRRLEAQLPIQPSLVIRLDSDWEEIAKHSVDSPRVSEANPENLAYVLYTSGSTGKPKGVEIPHSAIGNFLHSMQREPGFTAADTLLAVTTLSFDISGLEIYLPLITGGGVVIASTSDAHDPTRLIPLIRDSHCSVMQATPATWRALVDAGWKGSPAMKLLCGGESLPEDLLQSLLPQCAQLWNMYGPTETTVWSTIHKVTSAKGPIPIGRPIANTQVFVLDTNHNLAPKGVVGELYIGGAGLARGYLGRPELTDERFIQSPFEPGRRLYRTGDLARWLSDGSLECLGRVDNQVKLRGFRIELGEIEAVLSRHEAVRQCVVVVREDTPGNKLLVAYCQYNAESEHSVNGFRTYLKQSLPDYMLPSAFVPMEHFPLTPNGKIDRKALPPPHENPIENPEVSLPLDPLEQALVRTWSKVLKVKHVGLRDNFFELGGHSLAAVRLLSEIQTLTGRTLPLATLFQAPTVEAFAAILRKEGWTPSWSSLVPIQPSGSKPPLFLVHGAEGNVLLYRQVARHLGLDQPVYGLQSHGLSGDGSFETTVHDMAAQYIKEVMNEQPNGPYFLGGYCLGGIIAFEMAQQLTALGKPVEIVIMLDTYITGPLSKIRVLLQAPIHLSQNLLFHLANVVSLPAKDRRAFLSEKVDISLVRCQVRIHAMYHMLNRLVNGKKQYTYPHLVAKRLNDQAADRYVPAPYSGRVAVVRSKGYFLGLRSPSLGWDAFVRNGLEIHELPVYPRGMLIEPFCRFLANALRACLSSLLLIGPLLS